MTSTTFSPKPGGFFQSYRTALRQIRGVTLLYTAILAVALPLMLIFTVAQAKTNFPLYTPDMTQTEYMARQANNYLISSMPWFILPLLWLFALIFTVSLFRYLHDKRSVDLFHSLPVRRENLLLGRLAAEVTALAVPLLAMELLCLLILLIFGVPLQEPLELGALWLRIFFLLLDTLALLGLMIFFLICCGTVFDAVISTIAFCAGLPLLVLLSTSYVETALPGYAGDSIPMFLYRAMNPFLGAIILSHTVTAPVLLWWLFYAAVLLAAGVLLYRKRPSESAENAFAFPIPRVLIRFVVSACFGMMLGLLVHSIYPYFPFLLSALLGAFLAHLAIEAVYRRGVKGIWKTMRAYAVMAGLFVVFYLVCATGCFGYTNRIPAAEEVQTATFSTSYGTEHTIMLHTIDERGILTGYNTRLSIASQQENIEKVIALHQDIIDCYQTMGPLYPMSEGSSFEVSYMLKDGSVLRRRFYSTGFPADYEKKIQELSTLPEILENKIDCFCLTSESFDSVSLYDINEGGDYQSVSLDVHERAALVEALQADYLSGNALTNYYWDDYDVELSLTYQGDSSLPVSIAEDSALRTVLQLPDHEQLYLRGESYPISQKTFPNTLKVLQEIGAVL